MNIHALLVTIIGTKVPLYWQYRSRYPVMPQPPVMHAKHC